MVIWDIQEINFLILEDELKTIVSRADFAVKGSIASTVWKGDQEKTQQTDTHFQSSGSAEFNWRMIWSGVESRKGCPLDCELNLALFDKRVFSADFMVAEAVLDLKPFVAHVINNQSSFVVDATVPMTNKALMGILTSKNRKESLVREMEQVLADAGIDQYGNDVKNKDEESDDEGDDGKKKKKKKVKAPRQTRKKAQKVQKALKALQDTANQNKKIMEQFERDEAVIDQETEAARMPTAAKISLQLQVVLQTEANSLHSKVGIGRSHPNRNPELRFPTTGRTWDVVLPTVH